MRRTALALMLAALAILSAVQCIVSPGGSESVSATTRLATSGPSGAMRGGRVLSRGSPSKASSAKRSCQRHTGPGLAGPPHDLDGANAICAQQDDPGAPDVLVPRIALADERRQPLAPGGRNRKSDPSTHAPDSHAHSPKGIPCGLLC